MLFLALQKESPLGVPTQSAHPGTPPSFDGVLPCAVVLPSCLRRNNMVFLLGRKMMSSTHGFLIISVSVSGHVCILVGGPPNVLMVFDDY